MPALRAFSFGAAATILSMVQSPAPPDTAPTVRFHHAHYQVGDPSAAINATAAALEAVRVIVPGLGVGVRTGTEYLLFDRLDSTEPPADAHPPLRDGYASAVTWLKAHGIQADPPDAARLRVSALSLRERYHHIAFVAGDLRALTAALTRAGAVILKSTEEAVLFDGGAGMPIEIVRDADRTETFWCPMHPDVRSADSGACPVCGMSLVPIPPPKIGEYRLDVIQLRDRSRRSVSGLRLSVREPDTNALVSRFSVVHEKPFHLFVVGRDLGYFAHVHPEQTRDGTFTLAHPLPAGEYMLIADFLPEGGTSQMVQKAIIVPGTPRRGPETDASHGLAVRLETEDLAAGKHARLTFTVTEAATGAPVRDLQPYLGAPAHMLLVRRDLSDAIHAHPEEPATAGPAVSFNPIIPRVGEYKLWVQFQRRGQVSTASFELTVAR